MVPENEYEPTTMLSTCGDIISPLFCTQTEKELVKSLLPVISFRLEK